MNSDKKAKLKHFKSLNIREGTPKDLAIAIKTFIQQAVIIGEYELEKM